MTLPHWYCRTCHTTTQTDFYPYLRSKCMACKKQAILDKRKPCPTCGTQIRERPHTCGTKPKPVPPTLTCECGQRFSTYALLREHRANSSHWKKDTFAIQTVYGSYS